MIHSRPKAFSTNMHWNYSAVNTNNFILNSSQWAAIRVTGRSQPSPRFKT